MFPGSCFVMLSVLLKTQLPCKIDLVSWSIHKTLFSFFDNEQKMDKNEINPLREQLLFKQLHMLIIRRYSLYKLAKKKKIVA